MKKNFKKLVCVLSAVVMTVTPMSVLGASTAPVVSGTSIATRAITTTKPDLEIPYLGIGSIFRDCVAEPYVVFYKVPVSMSFKIDSKDSQYIEVTEWTKNHEENHYAPKVVYRGNTRSFSRKTYYTDQTTYVYWTVKNMANGKITLTDIKVSY